MNVPATPVRHPLGLPAGSVRSLLALGIAGLFWLLLLVPGTAEKPVTVPLFMYFLMALVLLYFFAHGRTAPGKEHSRPAPFGLPHFVFPLVIILGTAGVVALQYVRDPQTLLRSVSPRPEQLPQWPYLLAALGGGFGFGWVLKLGPWRNLPAFQDILAWLSLLAMLGLGVETLILLFINPNLEQSLDISSFEAVLTGLIACYFGARS